jgi:hypothetical protein
MLMMKRTMLFLSIALAVSCTAVRVDYMDQLRPRSWSVPEDGLSIRLALDVTTVAPGGVLPVKLFVRAFDSDRKPAHLLQGRIVYTFVPLGLSMGNPIYSTGQYFSGGGGFDYTGKTPAEHQMTAPPEAGQYLLFATVLSTQDDIKRFLMTARVSATAGPWWIGTMSAPAIHIAVASGAAVQPQ